MTTIWYSVCGEGMGHAIRSTPVIRELSKKHKVVITAFSRAVPYLRKRFGSKTLRIFGNTWIHKDNKILLFSSGVKYLFTLPFQLVYNFLVIIPFLIIHKPKIIISDFESMSHYIAKLFHIPCINIDNIHVLTECNLKKQLIPPLYHNIFLKYLHPGADYYFITLLKFEHLKKPEKSSIILPILRNKIISQKPVDKGHVLVYQTSPKNKKLIQTLKKTTKKHIVYGMGNKKKQDNVIFKEFSEKTFIEDLRTCSYIITNGGFTAISEAAYLKKPIFVMPIHNYVEQQYTGHVIQEKGWGMHAQKISLKKIMAFEKKQAVFKKNLQSIPKWNNDEFYRHLESKINELTHH